MYWVNTMDNKISNQFSYAVKYMAETYGNFHMRYVCRKTMRIYGEG